MSEQRFPVPFATVDDAVASAQVVESLAADMDKGRWEFLVDPWTRVRAGAHVVIPYSAWMKIEAELRRGHKNGKAPTAE